METQVINLHSKNPLVYQYISNQDSSLFHYSFWEEEDDKLRLEELSKREFPREQLSEHIQSYMHPFGITAKIEDSLQKLKQPNSAVVIGGQQAGLLTGPLYSIHKIISIILLSKEKEEKLGVPVVPVFWIAGEDHDIYEVNHVFVPSKLGMKKSTYKQSNSFNDKIMVSKVELDKVRLTEWIEEIVRSFGETNYSNEILQLLKTSLQDVNTYTEYFAKLVHLFFKKYGLLLVDSAHPELRKIERSYFCKMIENGRDITKLLLQKQEELTKAGYNLAIESDEENAHLFCELEGERILLRYDQEKNKFIGKQYEFTIEELYKMAEENPEKLSNNVVTRPLMQEFLFPTIAFIAGPGEISYWAELKKIFEHFQMKMPPIVPRLNITLLERNIEDDMRELNLSLAESLKRGVSFEKDQFIESLKDKQLEQFITAAGKEIEAKYKEILGKVTTFDKGLEPIIKKNSQIVQQQVQFLQRKVEESVKFRHEVMIQKFDRINRSLYPENGLQERCWNIFYFLNKYGMHIIDDLMEQPFVFNGDHYVVKL